MKNDVLKLKCLGLTFVLLSVFSVHSQEVSSGSSVNNQEKVVGGDEVDPEEFPWMVSLVMSDGSQGCGASLIHPRWVLTAGHCNLDFDGLPTIDRAIINSVIINVNELEPFSELIDVEEVIVHDDYAGLSGGGTGPDLALVKLSAPATTTPVELAELSDAAYYAGNEPAKVLGWGKTVTNGAGVDSLLLADCIFIAADTCAVLYSAAGPVTTYDANPGGNICAGYFSGNMPAGAAQGDSGGPLFFEDNQGDYKQVGIVSGGQSDVTTEEFPGIFTLVPKYKVWIDSVINAHENAASIEEIEANSIGINKMNNETIMVTGLVKTMPYSVGLFNLSGAQVGEVAGEIGGSTATLNISEYHSGMYIVRIINQKTGNSVVRKVVID